MSARFDLDAYLLELLDVCGCLKHRILVFNAARHGCGTREFKAAIARLRSAGKVREQHPRNGGVHYASVAWLSR
jgi:hypothetical protein